MIRALFFLLALTLAACLPTDDAGEGETAPISGTESDGSEVAQALAGIEPESLPVLTPDGEMPIIGQSRFDAEKNACLSREGRFSEPKTGHGFICFLIPPDGGKLCSKSTDCSAECLARTRTCTPITPLLGCHEIFTATGAIVTQCREI